MPVDGVKDVVKLVGPSGFLESQAELSFQEKDGDGLNEQKSDKHSKGGGNVMAGVVAVRRSVEVVDVRHLSSITLLMSHFQQGVGGQLINLPL